MKFNCGPTRREKLREKKERLSKWHPFYAWRPVRVGRGECRWLETVERKGIYHPSLYARNAWWEWEYRSMEMSRM